MKRVWRKLLESGEELSIDLKQVIAVSGVLEEEDYSGTIFLVTGDFYTYEMNKEDYQDLRESWIKFIESI